MIGQFGRYQKRIVIVVAFISFSTAFSNLGYVFWAARPDFHCVPDDRLKALVASAAGSHSNFTLEDELLLNLTVPWESAAGEHYHRSRSLMYLCEKTIYTVGHKNMPLYF